MTDTVVLPIIIGGATGRFGRLLLEMAKEDPAIKVVGLVSSSAPLTKCARTGAVVIDFTVPSATASHARLSAERGMPMVIATTGLGSAEVAAIRAASEKVPIVQTPNTSLGITLLTQWVREAARRLGPQYQVMIEETHHLHKKDAPSGTALKLRNAISEAAGCGEERITVTSRREGDTVGTHAVAFCGPHDTITLIHQASDRRLFCEGALRAAKWVVRHSPGLYTMEDVLQTERGAH
ncbi:MAG: 4-hydroxy-tetrahydrodipicolinate reductase [Deltaproteobacteria bacterium]|nr:4-hydroxy-tetrahydrodipicolinate reductase [Deltaproteobacteria bacterium]